MWRTAWQRQASPRRKNAAARGGSIQVWEERSHDGTLTKHLYGIGIYYMRQGEMRRRGACRSKCRSWGRGPPGTGRAAVRKAKVWLSRSPRGSHGRTASSEGHHDLSEGDVAIFWSSRRAWDVAQPPVSLRAPKLRATFIAS